MSGGHDVVVVGEVLVELSALGPLADGQQLSLSFSGDALNGAAAAAAAGASVALVARVGDDELGDALVAYAERLGIDTRHVRRVPLPNGVYFTVAHPAGELSFVYVRRGSAGSTLDAADVEAAGVGASRALLISGVGHAISQSSAGAVERAAELVCGGGGAVVYDPNFRPRLTSVARARAALARLAPRSTLVTPSHPHESSALFGVDSPQAAVAACLALGARAAAVTCGAAGVVLDAGTGPLHVPPAPAPVTVDATGAGDVFAGTATARLALGEDLEEAVRLGVAAAALSLAGRGGTGRLASIDEIGRHARAPATAGSSAMRQIGRAQRGR